MKKIITLMLLLLVNVPMVLAPEDKAEKLSHDNTSWNRAGQQFVRAREGRGRNSRNSRSRSTSII